MDKDNVSVCRRGLRPHRAKRHAYRLRFSAVKSTDAYANGMRINQEHQCRPGPMAVEDNQVVDPSLSVAFEP
jgi:hypothetical protein